VTLGRFTTPSYTPHLAAAPLEVTWDALIQLDSHALERPLVSVVIPTYQRAALLEEAVRSALAQTHDPLEVLVEDDGSTDGSGERLAALGDPRVRYAWAPNAGRPAPARNRGLARARGELVAFLDSDDVWEPSKLGVQVAALERDPSLLAVSCDARTLPGDRPYLGLDADRRPSFDELVQANVVPNSGVVVRREALGAVGLLDEDPGVAAYEDYDLWLRLLRHRDRSILVLREPLFRYRVSSDSISPGVGRRDLERTRRVLSKHLDFRPGLSGILAAREASLRRSELRAGLRDGSLSLGDWLSAPEVPLRRRLRLAAKALFVGRQRC